ncbi:hypothetical protein NLM59_08880 [Weeksellaceae bacterium KMM 9724]|uniref:hypothetical protein n=1 Tax=Profundicola chukchiensis TaxID=2961959 RepID=UPI00243D929B|nr:hypothetical protein [Profundicola chukchiensis]MDG4951038.1 hypothetical protein [Profundicola chukchiensis]
MWVRNTLAILAGLAVAMTLIMLAITANKVWFDELDNIVLSQKGDVFYYWQRVIKQAPTNFFIALLVSCGVGATIGGVVTAYLVENARQAYALFLGLILFLMAVADIIIFTDHPTWYEIGLFIIFFPFSWLGGKIVDELMKNKLMPNDK